MSSENPPEKRKLPIAKLVIGMVVLMAIVVLVLRGVDLAYWKDRFITTIRDAGPVAFFGAMAVLPAFGAPMMIFTIPAGEAFAPRLGMPLVIVLALVAVAVNLALAYWVARSGLRPLLTTLLTRYGYAVPKVTPENALNVALVVRLTPGPPYSFQCFVLGIAEVPFRLYMIVSWLAILPWAVGAIVLGQGLFSGNFAAAITGICVIVVATVAVQWIRRKYFARAN